MASWYVGPSNQLLGGPTSWREARERMKRRLGDLGCRVRLRPDHNKDLLAKIADRLFFEREHLTI